MKKFFQFEKINKRIYFKIITKNSAADPEIGLNVLVRAFLKEKREWLGEGSTPDEPRSSSRDTNR